jgi:MFS transporter, PAT family, solute carrier family 33 (acetyl-CoA transportor), member 1
MRTTAQDIAVDGWALTLLSRRHVGHAATCQTVGMNVGYFASFTVFLALNDAAFCNRYLRSAAAASGVGLVSLAAYLRFWAAVYAVTTLAIWLFKPERPRLPSDGSPRACAPMLGAVRRMRRCRAA